jgi:class 3 adenylate cyclase
MEPRIQYATTSDGVHIALAISGEGPTLVSVPSPPENHVELEWQEPSRRNSIEHLSRYRRLVRFDGRGTGLSDRNVDDFSLEARLRDMESVIERLDVPRFALISGGHGNQLTVEYAARHPDRVTHLIAVNPFARGDEFMSKDQLDLWTHLLRANFQMFTDALGAQTFGWGNEEGARFGEFFRACVEPEAAGHIYTEMVGVDLTATLSRVACPVLVMRTQTMGFGSEAAVRHFSAALRDARLVVLGGRVVEGATPEMIVRTGEFFGEDWSEAPEIEQPNRPHAEPTFRTVLFTDIEAHTAMMQRLGDTAGRDVLRTYERLTRDLLQRHGGTEVKALGDGFMASFRSSQRALDCAVGLQRAVAVGVTGLPADLLIRVGVNAGEPIEEDGDLFGSAVIAAARIVPLAVGGEILVSNVVRELVAGKGHLFADRGQHDLRGFEEPVRLWELKWRATAEANLPTA